MKKKKNTLALPKQSENRRLKNEPEPVSTTCDNTNEHLDKHEVDDAKKLTRRTRQNIANDVQDICNEPIDIAVNCPKGKNHV